MANPEHVKILECGVTIWNEWRKKFPNERPDLSKADISEFTLIGVNLSNADLSNANLSSAFLLGSILNDASLYKAYLFQCTLNKANLVGANLIRSNLVEANLVEANLMKANLSHANLSYANLHSVNLSHANLSYANLSDADLRYANFSNADLHSVNLSHANLSYSNFCNANFSNADLAMSNLSRTNFNDTNLSGTNLYMTSRDYWKIEGVKCDYIYWEFEGEERTPKDRDFRPGEFEELYKWKPLDDFEKLVARSIEFPEEYKEAGISILNYFSEILRKKYHETSATVQIKQDGLKVSMIIDPGNGNREVIEKALYDYGLVVRGKMTPEEFCDDPLQAMRLRNKLEMAEMELRQTRQFLQFAEKNYSQRIESLECEISRLHQLVGDVLQNFQKPDVTHIQCNGDVSFVKDQARANHIKNSQAGVIGDECTIGGNIGFGNHKDE